jgi:hypothetical protein
MELFRALLTPLKILASWGLMIAITASLFGSAGHAQSDRALPTLHAPEMVIEVVPLVR